MDTFFHKVGDWFANRQRGKAPSATQLSWGKMAAFVATCLLWGFGCYNGWVYLPVVADWSSLALLLVAIVGAGAIAASALADRKMIRLIGLLGAFIAGVVLAVNFTQLMGMFSQFNWLGMTGGLVALAITLAVGVWICRAPRRIAPTSAATPASPTTPTPAP